MIYCELMVSPDHAADMGISYGTLIAAVTEGIQSARESEAIEARVIVTCVRHRGPECAVQLAKLVTANPHPLVTGFGMAGDEEKYRPRDFATAFAIARDAGLGCTCHAGERCGPAAVWETIQELGVARLGHGVRSIEDRSLVEHISEVGFILEVCPTSNLKLGLYASPKEHPFLRLLRTGCKVTLNSDDPAHFDGSLLQEYRDAQHHFNLTDADVGGITRTAIEGAFCDAETKARLMGLLQVSP